MLFKLSLRNIKKSLKDYAIYFFTLVLGVTIFYVFNAIETQTVLMDVSQSSYEIIDIMNNSLSAVSVFVAFVLGLLIIYANQFLMKRRGKEFGIYLTLGMSKRKISFILFFETLLIGLISLIIGLGLGIVLSQLMSLLIVNMFEADMSRFTFIFSKNACIKTLFCFSIMYMFVICFNSVVVNRYKLIDLLHSSSHIEKVKMKNPILCTFVFIIACCTLGYAYWLVTGGLKTLQYAQQILIPIALGIISTFLIFWSLSGLLLRLFMRMKKVYYNGLNHFVLRQFSSEINTNVFSMTVICLMLFMTICFLSCSLSIKNSIANDVDDGAPCDIQIIHRMNISDSALKKEYNKEQIKNSHLNLVETLDRLDINIFKHLKNFEIYNIYTTDELTLQSSLGNQYKIIQKKLPLLPYESKERIMKISDYNRIAKLYGHKQFTLKPNEYIIIADYPYIQKQRNKALATKEKIYVFSHQLTPKYSQCQEGFIDINSSTGLNHGIILIDDSVVNEEYISYNGLVGNYFTHDKKEIKKIEMSLNQLSHNKLSKYYKVPTFNSKHTIIEGTTGLGAMIAFIGIYLGIIFLISGAAILALKMLSENADNIQRYTIIKKIGADNKMIYQALLKQIGIFFLFPLMIASIHSIFGIKFSIAFIELYTNNYLLESILITVVVVLFIYGGYFLITYLFSKNIIHERN